MKKLNITKKQFSESNYFQKKYGTLKYVSESGNVYKTDKGNVLKFVKESKNLVNEGAGAGYTVEIKGLKFGKIIDYKYEKGKKSWEDSCKVKVEVVHGTYEIGAESYYDDFFWQEHEFDITPDAKIDGGYAIFDIGLNGNPDEDDESYMEMVRELENRELDISFMYGAGWSHADLPREKIVVDSVDIEGSDVYFSIDKLVLNAPDLADAVNSGWKSTFDREDDEEESMDESYIGDKVKDSKNLVKEGAGAGYTVHIKGLRFGKIMDMNRVKDSDGYSYPKCMVEILPGEYEIEAEDYYNDFFWQEHEFGEKVFAKIDGGVAEIGYTGTGYDGGDPEDVFRGELEDREFDIAFSYGWGWTYVYLPNDKPIKSDHIKIEGKDFYGYIDKIELNAPDLADAVNSGYESLSDREDGDEEFDESYIGDKVKDGWKKVKDGAKKLKTKIGDMFNGPFRKGERVEMSGENGETVKGTITGFDLGDKTYTVLLGRDEY